MRRERIGELGGCASGDGANSNAYACGWRGIGVIGESGYGLAPAYAAYDAERKFDVEGVSSPESPECIAGDVLRGIKRPHDCPAFGTLCTPEKPLGAPMVSSEGACAAYFTYKRHA